MFEWFRKWILRGVVLHEDDKTVIRQEDFASLNYIKAQIASLNEKMINLHNKYHKIIHDIEHNADYLRDQIIAVDKKFDPKPKKKKTKGRKK